MKITIDGQEIQVNNPNDNIVEIAEDNGIGIPAPCYRTNRKHGCCNGCVITVDGEQKYACVTKPAENMVIEVNTPELRDIRKNKFKLYKEAIDTGIKLPCDCGDGCGDDDCGCGDGCGCG